MNTAMLVFEVLNEIWEQPFYGSFKDLSRPQPWHEIANTAVFDSPKKSLMFTLLNVIKMLTRFLATSCGTPSPSTTP